MKQSIKIVLADDELLFRKAIAFLLQYENNFEVVYEASNGNEVINYINNCQQLPDIILMDLKMPDLNGVETTKILNKEFPGVKIIALTSYNTKSFIANMLDVGACSYLVKNATPKEMITTINEVYDNGFYYNQDVMDVINSDIVATKVFSKTILDNDYFTTREKEVLQLVCQQYNNAEIAQKLFISARTVEGHRNNILIKSGTKNLAGLVVYAIQNKLVQLENLTINQ